VTSRLTPRLALRARAGFLPLLILNSTLAYCQNLSNFLVTKHTSALTLQARGRLCAPFLCLIAQSRREDDHCVPLLLPESSSSILGMFTYCLSAPMD
jgi:hypothetical protein